MQDSFILYLSYKKQFNMLSDRDKGRLIMALFAHAEGEDISNTLSPLASMAYAFITQQMSFDYTKYKAKCEQNRQNAMKRWQRDGDDSQIMRNNATASSRIQSQCEAMPPHQVAMHYDNDNDLLVNNKNNINNNACTHACVSDNSYLQKCFKTFFSEVFDYCVTDKFLIPANEIIDVMVDAYQQAQSPNGFKFNHTTYNASTLLDMFVKVDAYNFRSIVNQLVFNESIENRPLYIMGCLIMASQDKKCSNTPEQIEALQKALTQTPHPQELNQPVQPAPPDTAG